jgi:hypothetical protein
MRTGDQAGGGEKQTGTEKAAPRRVHEAPIPQMPARRQTLSFISGHRPLDETIV